MKGATCTLDTEVATRTLENKFSATREECTELGNTIERPAGNSGLFRGNQMTLPQVQGLFTVSW